MAQYIILTEFARLCGTEPDEIRELLDYGLLQGRQEQAEPEFPPDQVIHVRRIRRLRHHMGVNLEGIDIILNMRQQMEEMQRELEEMQQRMQEMEHLHKRRLQQALERGGFLQDSP